MSRPVRIELIRFITYLIRIEESIRIIRLLRSAEFGEPVVPRLVSG